MQTVEGCEFGDEASPSEFSKGGVVHLVDESDVLGRFDSVQAAICFASEEIVSRCGDCRLCVPVPVVFRAHLRETDQYFHLREHLPHLLHAGVVRVVGGVVSSPRFEDIIKKRQKQGMLRQGDFNRIVIKGNPIGKVRSII